MNKYVKKAWGVFTQEDIDRAIAEERERWVKMNKSEKVGDKMEQLKLEDVRFNGPEYTPEYDKKRLTGQIQRVFYAMKDGIWRTLNEIHAKTGDPHASISAQLRHLRKPKFGGFTVNRRARGGRERGLFEYQLELKGEKK